jgi:hypothetical protein
MTHPTTHSLARLLAAAGVIVLGRTLTAHHPDPATAAESGFLTLWAGGVLGSLVLCSRATGAVVAASLWCAVAFGLPGAAGTRGALVAAALVAVASWSTWRSLAGEGAVRWGDALGLAFAWQALLRGVELAAGPSTLETVIDLAGPPILLAAAAVHLGRAAGRERVLVALAPLVLLAPGLTLVPAAALMALAVAGADRPPTWRETAAVGGAAALAVGQSAAVGVPLLVLVGALACRHHRGWRWLPALAAVGWAVGRSPVDLAAGAGLLLAVPFAVLAPRERWPCLAAACALGLGTGSLGDPTALAPAAALLAASVPEAKNLRRQAAWGLGLLTIGSLAATYPWLRHPFHQLPDRHLGLPVPVLVLIALAGLWLLSRRPGATRPAWMLGLAAAVAAAPFLAPVQTLMETPVVLDAETDAWRAVPPLAPIERLSVDSFLMNAGDAGDGSVVATVRLFTVDGEVLERPLRLGTDTADWAARRGGRSGPQPWLTWVAADGSLAQRYRTDWHLARARRIERLEITRAGESPSPLELALLQVVVR